ncbi:MAG: glycosyltransferase [Candidatus Paceibacterota bacterium]|jgi:glycosyltransferase involved in cell wall biosynthesis
MITEKPLISVLMPVYNGSKYLRQSIQSILDQTEGNFELIIVDDGSTDNAKDIVSSFTDSRVLYLVKEHSGLVDTLRFGIKNSKGIYIARIDCDDVMEVTRLKEQLLCMEGDNSIAICGSWASVIDDGGKEFEQMIYPPLTANKIRRYAMLHNPFIHSTVMIRRSVLEDVGEYSPFFKHCEDYELWVRILYRFNVVNLDKKLVRYRSHQNQITRKFNFTMRAISLIVRIKAVYFFILRLISSSL